MRTYLSKKYLLIILLCITMHNVYGNVKYEIEAAYNDEVFIISGEKFKAKTYCYGWQEGEKGIFLEGSPYDASAFLYNTNRSKTCGV